jgi:hypothetical protein
MSTVVSTTPAKSGGGPLGFLKKISLRTWLLGGFVVLFLIWFIPRIGTFAKIAGLLGLGAALAFLAPVLLPVIAGLAGGLAAAIAASIVAAKKSFAAGDEETESQDIATGAHDTVESNSKNQGWEEEEVKIRDDIGVQETRIIDRSNVDADDVGQDTVDAENAGKVNPDPIDDLL